MATLRSTSAQFEVPPRAGKRQNLRKASSGEPDSRAAILELAYHRVTAPQLSAGRNISMAEQRLHRGKDCLQRLLDQTTCPSTFRITPLSSFSGPYFRWA